MNILLDYFFPITTIEPTAEVATGFLKQVCVVAKPKSGQEGNVGTIYECTTMTQVAARTDNTESQQLFNAGKDRVFILLMDDLDLADALEGHESDFFTLLISSDFSDEEVGAVGTAAVKASRKIQDITYTAKVAGVAGNSITINYNTGGTAGSEVVTVVGSAISVAMEDGVSTAAQLKTAIENSVAAMALIDALAVDVGDEADKQDVFGSALALQNGADAIISGDIDLGEFSGVVGLSSDDDSFLGEHSVTANRCAMHSTTSNKAKNLFYAFGKMLSNISRWKNQQFIEMPFADDVDTLGEANSLFDDKISFVISDDQYNERLALFAAGGKAIVAPYVKKNLELDLQSAGLAYVSGNQPAYTMKEAALLEDELQKVVQGYIDNGDIEDGVVTVSLEDDGFDAQASINIAEPKALWRVIGEMRQTL